MIVAHKTKAKGGDQNEMTTESKPIICLSMGAGVQTTCLLLMNPKKYDYVVFADTGDEKPETYYYMENYLKPFCTENNVNWVTVKKTGFESLMDYCIKKELIPTRNFRWCTDKFKIRPIRKFIKSLKSKSPVIQDIGISLDESHRANFSGKYGDKYTKFEYPLIEQKITRKQCYEIIQAKGYPIPPKSGCYYCPYAGKQEIRKLHAENKPLYDKAVLMEKNNKQYPKMTLFNVPLNNLNEIQSLDDFTCDSGHCFV